MKWSLRDLGAITTATAFTLTVVYVLGYSLSAGINLFLYFGTHDYLRLAIEWFPPVLFTIVLATLLNEYVERIGEGSAANTGAESSLIVRRDNIDRVLPAIVFIAAILLSGGVVVLNLTPVPLLYVIWAIGAPFTWLLFVNWYLALPQFRARWDKLLPHAYVTLTAMPMLLIATFFYGLYSGATGLRLYIPARSAEIVIDGEAEGFSGRVLFALTDYLIVAPDASSDRRVYPQGRVQSIEYRVDEDER